MEHEHFSRKGKNSFQGKNIGFGCRSLSKVAQAEAAPAPLHPTKEARV